MLILLALFHRSPAVARRADEHRHDTLLVFGKPSGQVDCAESFRAPPARPAIRDAAPGVPSRFPIYGRRQSRKNSCKSCCSSFLPVIANLFGIDDDDEIAGIDVRGKDQFFLAAEKICRLDRDMAKDLIFGVDDPPFTGDFVGFSGKGFHQGGKGTETTGEGARCQTCLRPNRRRARGSDKGVWHLGCFLEIIMRLAVLLPIVYSLFARFRQRPTQARQPQFPIMSQPRQSSTKSTWPAKSSALRDAPRQRRQNYCGHVYLLPGNVRLRTQEGTRALDDAIRFLHNTKPRPPLALSPGLCLAAADHCREQLAVQRDITATMAVIPGIESVAMAW